jgi:hypothetical protein
MSRLTAALLARLRALHIDVGGQSERDAQHDHHQDHRDRQGDAVGGAQPREDTCVHQGTVTVWVTEDDSPLGSLTVSVMVWVPLVVL